MADASFLEKASNWAYSTYVVLVSFTALATFFVVFLSSRVAQQRKAELIRAQAETAKAYAEAVRAAANAEEAKTQAASAMLEQEKLRQENLQLSIRLEEERKARLEIEERLAPRRISDTQHEFIVAHLIKFKGQKVTLFPCAGDGEIERFASQLATALRKAGIEVAVTPRMVFGGAQNGVTMQIGNDRLKLANAISEALILSKVVKSPAIPATKSADDNDLTITVGPKP